MGVEFYSNERLGPMCRVPKLRAKSMQVNTMVYHSFGSMGLMLFNALPKLVKSSISPESFEASLDDFLMTLPDTFIEKICFIEKWLCRSQLDQTHAARARSAPREAPWGSRSSAPRCPRGSRSSAPRGALGADLARAARV